jgi:hypothetical protein
MPYCFEKKNIGTNTKMPCLYSCSLAFVFILAMIYFHFMTMRSQVVQHYKQQLPSKLKTLYDRISRERMQISLEGYGLGFVLSAMLLYFQRNKLSNTTLVCATVTITFITNYFYYLLHKKSDWMLNHINTAEQTRSWLQMYREMQFNYHAGFVFGIVAVGLFTYAYR